MAVRIESNNQAVYEDDKLYLRFDGNQGGTLVDFRWKRQAPNYNVCQDKGGMWLNTSYDGISDGTNKGAYQATEKRAKFTRLTAQDLWIEGEMHYGDRLNELGPFRYKIGFSFWGGWIYQKIVLTCTAAVEGKRFYAINQAMDFDQSWNKAIVPSRKLWVGRSEEWRLATIGTNDINEVETIQELGHVSTLYKIFGNMRSTPQQPLWGGMACGDFGLIVVAPRAWHEISIGWNAGFNWALDGSWRSETVGNSFVRSLETAHILGDGNRRYLESLDPNSGIEYRPPNPLLRDGQIISWDVALFPYEGRNVASAVNWVRSSGYPI